MRSALTISRRSTAIGWRRAMVRTARSSISRCRSSIAASAAITRSARSTSRLASASTESAICFSARPPISATMRDKILQIDVEGLGGVFVHHCHCSLPLLACRLSRSGR